MDRRRRVLVTAAVVAALLAPVALDHDGFPLSTYPMYSRTRGSIATLVTAQAVDEEGRVSSLSLEVIGGSDDPLVVAGELRRVIAAGRAAQRCREIAGRAVGGPDLAPHATAIEVVTERRDVVAHVSGQRVPIERVVHASCELEP